jgi:uncharacterized membrane protein
MNLVRTTVRRLKTEDSRTRSVAKALTWRLTATTTTGLIAFLVIGEVGAAVTIGAIEFISKFIIYYAHERAWLRFR